MPAPYPCDIMIAQQQGRRRSRETEVTQGTLRALTTAGKPVPVLSPAPPIPTLAPADHPEPEHYLLAIRGLWVRVALGIGFWLAFGVLMWVSLR
jgi:hypothetical protein